MDKSSKNSSPEKRLSPPKRDDAPGAYGVQPGPKSWAIVADEALGGQPRDSMSQTYSDAIMSWNASVINDQESQDLPTSISYTQRVLENQHVSSSSKAGRVLGASDTELKGKNKPVPPLPRDSEEGPKVQFNLDTAIEDVPRTSHDAATDTPLLPRAGSKKKLATHDPKFGFKKLRNIFQGPKVEPDESQGFHPIPKDSLKSKEPPTSVPLENVSDIWRGVTARPDQDKTERKVTSGPAVLSSQPTKRYLEENNLSPIKQKRQPVPRNDDTKGFLFNDGLLAPTRQGSYAVTKKIEVQRGLSRATSHQGIVELMEDNPEDNPENTSEHKPEDKSDNEVDDEMQVPMPTSSEADPGVTTTTSASAVPYTPSIYEGIWENNASVGHTLPPFSPAEGQDRFSSQQIPTINEEDASALTVRLPRVEPGEVPLGLLRSIGSRYSINASIRTNNSFAQSAESWSNQSAIMSSPLHPRYGMNVSSEGVANEEGSASFPRIPSSFRGFEPSLPQPAALSRVEQTLHHHIDACFERLTKLVTDKTDRLADTLHERCDVLEDRIATLSTPEAELEKIKGSVDEMKTEVKESLTGAVVAVNDSVDLIRALGTRMDAVEREAQARSKAKDNDKAKAKGDASVPSRRGSQAIHVSATSRRGRPRHYRTNTTGTVEGFGRDRDQDMPGLMERALDAQTPRRRAKHSHEPGSTIPMVEDFGTGVLYEPMTMPVNDDDEALQAAEVRARNANPLGGHPAYRTGSSQASIWGADRGSGGLAFGQQDPPFVQPGAPRSSGVSVEQPGATFPYVMGFNDTLYELPSFVSESMNLAGPRQDQPPHDDA